MLIFAIVFVTLALLFYTAGVWVEKLKNVLKKWHVAVFWLGFICNAIGMTAMGQISKTSDTSGIHLHSVVGVSALVLMFLHAAWATFVVIKHDEKAIKPFHKFSIIVWIIWLIPYFTGVIMGINS